MSNFYLGDSDDSGPDLDENDSDLPFPKPLARSSFLAPDFDPTVFLSSLSNRHQTLEDLRTELRDLSHALKQELLDLVNENYRDFLSLGTTLQGGDEKVEQVRVGLLGFQRDVGAMRERVDVRKQEMGDLLGQKKQLRSKTTVGKTLLDIAERIEELEESLMISETKKPKSVGADGNSDDDAAEGLYPSDTDESEDDDESTDADDLAVTVSLRRLVRHVQQYICIQFLGRQVGDQHPFLVNQAGRLKKIKETIQLDINTALSQIEQAGHRGEAKITEIKKLSQLLEGDASIEATLTKGVEKLKV